MIPYTPQAQPFVDMIQFYNSIVITVPIHRSHRQEYGLQLWLYSYSVIGTPAIAYRAISIL